METGCGLVNNREPVDLKFVNETFQIGKLDVMVSFLDPLNPPYFQIGKLDVMVSFLDRLDPPYYTVKLLLWGYVKNMVHRTKVRDNIDWNN